MPRVACREKGPAKSLVTVKRGLLIWEYISGLKYDPSHSKDLDDILIEKVVSGLSADLSGHIRVGMHLTEIDHHTILHMDIEEVRYLNPKP